MARDDRKNPLISPFDWTNDAVQRVFRVPAGFMRNQTQERIEALARERAVAAIDLALVEDGIEIGKQMIDPALPIEPDELRILDALGARHVHERSRSRHVERQPI